LVLILGYLGVFAGVIVYSATFALGKQGWVEVLVLPVGVGLAGFASWRWMVASRTEQTEATGSTSVPLRIMAASCAVFAVGEAVMAHIISQEHSSLGIATDPSFHYTGKMIGEVLACGGFLLTAVGFWLASLDVKTPTTVTEAALPVA
jgi:hypothetical protein